MSATASGKHVVIAGISSLRNRGVEALLLPVVKGLRDHGARVTVLTRDVNYDGPVLEPLTDVARDPFFDAPTLKSRLTDPIARRPRSKRGNAPIYRLLESADVVVGMGGDVFSSDYGDLTQYLAPFVYARSADVPVALLGHSIGPFRSAREELSFRTVFSRSITFTVRESATSNYVGGSLEFAPNTFELVPDPAFALEYSLETGRRLRQLHGIPDDLPLLVLAPSQGITSFGRGANQAGHLAAWRELVDDLSGQVDATLLLVAHVQDSWPGNDDRRLVTRLAETARRTDRVRLVTTDLRASGMKSLISTADLVVAERMHAAIAGLSSGTPTVPVAYSVKARGIMNDLGLGHLVLELDELIAGRGAPFILDAWTRRNEIGEALRPAAAKARDRATRHVDALIDAMG